MDKRPLVVREARLLAIEEKGLRLEIGKGVTKLLDHGSVGKMAVAVISEPGASPYLLLDLVLDGAAPLRLVRISSRETSAPALLPQAPAKQAWQHLAARLLQTCGAFPLPSANAVVGRDYAVFPNVAAFESAIYAN